VNENNTAQSVQNTPTASPGISTVNLRGLGSNRTLVLLDGRRTQPANASLVVDLNIIPKAALDGVEVITGGAGATYGADAVAGVVNFKLKRHFTGITMDARMGITARGDGRSTALSTLIGGDFADGRGNAMLSVGYERRETVTVLDRPFYVNGFLDPGTGGGSSFLNYPAFAPSPTVNGSTFFNYGTQGLPTQAAVNSAFSNYGVVAGDVSRSAVIYFNPSNSYQDATLFSGVKGVTSGTPVPNYKGSLYPDYKIQSNGNLGGNAVDGYLSAPITRYSIFGNAYYDVADGLTVYVQALFDQNETETQSTYAPAVNQWGVGIPFDAATCGAATGHQVPGALCTILSSRGTNGSAANSPWELNRGMTFMGPERLLRESTTYEVLTGVRGNIGIKDWTFDLFGSHGRSTQIVRYRNFVDLGQYQTLIALPNWGANAVISNARIGVDAKCTSGLSPFLPDSAISQDCKDLITANAKTYADLIQNQAEVDIQGGLVDLPAGEMRFAAGADYRKDTFSYEPDDAFNGNNIDSLTVGLFSTLPAGGSQDVKEIYGELLIPVLKDLPGIQSLSLNAGYRYSDYNTEGGVTTWKLTADWTVTDWFRLRGGYQRANRAPNVAELFQPGTYIVVAWPEHDPCSNLTRSTWGNNSANSNRQKVLDLCNAVAGTQTAGPGGTPLINASYAGNQPTFFPLGRDYVKGNPNAESEKASTWTVGAVFSSPRSFGFGRFNLSLDWYNIKVEGAIQPASTDFVYRQCFNADGTSNASYDANNAFCKLIVRSNTTGFWLAVNAEFQNLGMLQTSGLDAVFDWTIGAPGLGGDDGSVAVNVGFNYLDKYLIQGVPGGAITDYADTVGNSITNAPFGAQFRWKLNTTISYNFGPGSIALSWRHLPKVRNTAAAANPATTTLPTNAYDLFGLNGRVKVNSMLELSGGIDNLFDRDPPIVGAIPGTTNASGTTDSGAYDVLGRRFYVGARLKF
jgi:outer membrane receptor protein involved in Fe transport